MEQLLSNIENLIHADWFNAAISAVVIVGLTAVVARLVTLSLRHILRFNEQNNLPSSSIFVNILRGTIWFLGICIMLSTCFGVDVSAAITAFGVGGIAISLGFQDTISNLIGGLQVSLMRIVKPGDNIQVGSSVGVVKDVTWRHTTIKNSLGQEIVIPNSIINKTTLVHLPPANQVSVPFVVATSGLNLDNVAQDIERIAEAAASGVGKVSKPPAASFSEITESGFKGSVIFRMADSRDGGKAADTVLRAIAPLTRQISDLEESSTPQVSSSPQVSGTQDGVMPSAENPHT